MTRTPGPAQTRPYQPIALPWTFVGTLPPHAPPFPSFVLLIHMAPQRASPLPTTSPSSAPLHSAGGLGICVRFFGPAIAKLYATGLALGTVYSVPPLRLKRFAVSAFLIIAFVRGFLLNFGVYQAVRAALGLPFVWSRAIT